MVDKENETITALGQISLMLIMGIIMAYFTA